jgi:hypothetical protein
MWYISISGNVGRKKRRFIRSGSIDAYSNGRFKVQAAGYADAGVSSLRQVQVSKQKQAHLKLETPVTAVRRAA